MRLLFICKRHPQQRDLLERPYGRFYHLPLELAARGHEVHVIVCSHRGLDSTGYNNGGVYWSSHDVRTLGVRKFWLTICVEAKNFQPDWIIGCSDAWFGWIARKLSSRLNAMLAIDAYDNYEAYMPWNLPLHWLWRRAIRAADLVTAAGPQLAQRLQSYRVGKPPVELIAMSADPEFIPADKKQSRQALGLPLDGRLVGYVGSWAANRGTSILIQAFRRARASQPDLQMVLSGRPPAYAVNEPGVIGVGYIKDEQLPTLINSLDIACVVTANTGFGRYSYPAKLCEAMACKVPVVATATEPVRWMLDGRREHLTPIGDADAFAEHILNLLVSPHAEYGARVTWAEQAEKFDYVLSYVGRQNR